MAALPETTETRTWLSYDGEPARRIGVRVEQLSPGDGPRGGVPGDLRPVIVLCHGFKGFMDWGFLPHVSTCLARAGFVSVSMNASGCGVGDDPLVMDDEEAFFRDTYTRQLEDIRRVREYARGLAGVDSAREALLGHSRGGGMGVISAAEEPPASLVTWAAIDQADRFDEATKAHWRAEGELRIPNGRTGQIHRLSLEALEDLETNAERLDILAAARRYGGPLLAIHGRKDTTVPWAAADRLAAAAARGSSLIVDGASHGFDASHPMEQAPAALETAITATLDHLEPLIDGD